MGGVVKIMDYVGHARSLGYDVAVWAPRPLARDGELFAHGFHGYLEDAGIRFRTGMSFELGEQELMFISLPVHYNQAYRNLPAGRSPERIIHIVQNVRHVNPSWHGGQGSLVLTRPAARISINQIVADTIEPWLDRRGLHRVVNLGHDASYFAKERAEGLSTPLRVAYTTWKSDVGVRVERALHGEAGLEFASIRDTATWPQLRELYHWADVFLSTPSPEEGMYLPGLEAMAAGALVVTPDVGGNMAYCRPGDNCLVVGYDSVADYVSALRRLAAAPGAEVESLRSAGYATVPSFDLGAERRGFAAFLDELWSRVRTFEADQAGVPA
jgi:hypothetical protein